MKAPKKAKRITRELTPFSKTGDKMLMLVSGLHSSRVSAYGYTAEAEVLGVTRYTITEQLDIRICPVCRVMHGKSFEVKEARRLLDKVLYETNPDILKTLQPWPSQRKSAVDAMSRMTEDQLVARAWHIPPYHPNCRGLLVAEHEVIPAIPTTYTEEDFTKAGIFLPQNKFVDEYNPLGLKVGPSDWAAAFNSVFSGSQMRMQVYRQGDDWAMQIGAQGNEGEFYRKIYFENGEMKAYHDIFDIHEEFQGHGLSKRALAAHVNLYKKLGVSKVEVGANISVGSYAWAKYGFVPADSGKARGLALRLKTKLQNLIANKRLPPTWTEAEVKHVFSLISALEGGDARALWRIADIAKPVEGTTSMGKFLLLNDSWFGVLDLSDAEAMARLEAYVGA